MKIRFTKHAEAKFGMLHKHGIRIAKQKLIQTLLSPETTDRQSRAPLSIAQSTLDQNHVLRVAYRQKEKLL